jgi:hypothetical protein
MTRVRLAPRGGEHGVWAACGATVCGLPWSDVHQEHTAAQGLRRKLPQNAMECGILAFRAAPLMVSALPTDKTQCEIPTAPLAFLVSCFANEDKSL